MSGAGTPPTVRDQLADALKGRWVFRGDARADDLADALLPTVQRLLEEARAEGARQALHDAADDWRKPGRPHRPVPDWLRDRAAAIPTTPQEPG